MIGADLLRVGVFCALPFATSAAAIVALALVAGLATGFFRPAVYAGLPNLVEERDLAAGNALLQTVENLDLGGRPARRRHLVAASGPHVAYWINAVRSSSPRCSSEDPGAAAAERAAAISRGHWRDLGTASPPVRSRALLTVLIALEHRHARERGVNVGEVFPRQGHVRGRRLRLGLLCGAVGVGLALGSLAASILHRAARASRASTARARVDGCRHRRRPRSRRTSGSPPRAVVVPGAGNGAAVVCNALLVQRGRRTRCADARSRS